LGNKRPLRTTRSVSSRARAPDKKKEKTRVTFAKAGDLLRRGDETLRRRSLSWEEKKKKTDLDPIKGNSAHSPLCWKRGGTREKAFSSEGGEPAEPRFLSWGGEGEKKSRIWGSRSSGGKKTKRREPLALNRGGKEKFGFRPAAGKKGDTSFLTKEKRKVKRGTAERSKERGKETVNSNQKRKTLTWPESCSGKRAKTPPPSKTGKKRLRVKTLRIWGKGGVAFSGVPWWREQNWNLCLGKKGSASAFDKPEVSEAPGAALKKKKKGKKRGNQEPGAPNLKGKKRQGAANQHAGDAKKKKRRKGTPGGPKQGSAVSRRKEGRREKGFGRY